MSGYLMTWITKNLAVGHAPMSYAELDDIKEQGIDAIVNLCEEFSDLHELEEQAGFEVFYLPITDEHAPEIVEMEKALEWLDEATYLGKKVLVHCKHGVGRTGTFVTAYLLRRGLGLRKAEKILRKTRANPTNFSQWWLLRKFGRKEGRLKIGEATPDNRNSADLSQFYARYQQLLRKIDTIVNAADPGGKENQRCEKCSSSFSLAPIEAIYLNDHINTGLSAEQRRLVIEKSATSSSQKGEQQKDTACPLYQDQRCLLRQHRPIQCRIRGVEFTEQQINEISDELSLLSTEIFESIFNQQLSSPPPSVDRSDAISGKFIQKYFQYLSSRKNV
jgi:protein-tyrosine phosphatase